MIYSFSPFGYEGALVAVEVDLRRGIPSVDLVGLADGAVKESRERMIAAIRNSGFEFPSKRVLISLSPADLKKEGAGFDLPMALGVLESYHNMKVGESVLVMGELELSGNLRPVRGVRAAFASAAAAGIRYAIVPKADYDIPAGIQVKYVTNLNEAFEALKDIETNNFSEFEKREEEDEGFKVEFPEYDPYYGTLDDVEGRNGLKYAMAVAVAGRHNIIAWGCPGCGKTLVLQRMPQLMPKLTSDERPSVSRIYSLAGLDGTPAAMKNIRPFRMPHQTASIEGIFGGGINCRPGEISLAHNGVLFLDEAAEFRTSVLQMLRVPLETGTITLSRAGRTTVYPANFQLAMVTNPCPCGNYGSDDRICLCSPKSVELYWRKFSAPLLDRIAIRFDCSKDTATTNYTVDELKELIKTAWERQYKRQGKLNQMLNPQEVADYIKLTDDAKSYLDKVVTTRGLSQRAITNILKVARTLADMHAKESYDVLTHTHIEQAVELFSSIPLD